MHDLLLKQQNQGEYQVKTSGNDPYLFTGKLAQQIPADHYLFSFEYFCPAWLDHLQMFFAPPVSENKSIIIEVGVAEGS